MSGRVVLMVLFSLLIGVFIMEMLKVTTEDLRKFNLDPAPIHKTKLAKKLFGKDNENAYSVKMEQPVKPGMTNILDIIFELESTSGTNKKAYVPNEEGALGGYQLKPGAFEDIQRVFPERWAKQKFNAVAKNDVLAREAASDYLQVIKMHYGNNNLAPTVEALLAGYHSGMGNVVKGNIGEKGLEYIEKANILRGI